MKSLSELVSQLSGRDTACIFDTAAVLFLMYILSYHKRANGKLEGWNVLLSINDHYDIIPVVALCSLKTSAFEVVR